MLRFDGKETMDVQIEIPGWHSIHEWARRLGCHKRTVRNYCDKGLKFSKIGSLVLIHEADVEDWIQRHSRGGNLRRPAK
jgi:excisionase family DNA binding protein